MQFLQMALGLSLQLAPLQLALQMLPLHLQLRPLLLALQLALYLALQFPLQLPPLICRCILCTHPAVQRWLSGHAGAERSSNLRHPILLSSEWFSTLPPDFRLLLPLQLALLMLSIPLAAVHWAGEAANTCWSAAFVASC